jgi:hypothetical protein
MPNNFFDTDEELEAYFKEVDEEISALGTANGIKHTSWAIDDMEIEDFDKPHDFTGGNPFIYFTNSSCKGCQGVYGLCQLEDGKYPMTWLDVWKVIDRIRGLHPNCDHRFIEDITEDGDGIFIQFGS